MPVTNIVDKRTNKYKIECKAVLEPSWHDNSVPKSTQFIVDEEHDFTVHVIEDSAVWKAFSYVENHYPMTEVTVYLYDIE